MLTRRRTEAERIRDAYRHLLVAAPADLPRAADEVDVSSFDALLEVGAQLGRPVAHLADPWTGADVFFVDDGTGLRYRYRAEGRPVRPGRRVAL